MKAAFILIACFLAVYGLTSATNVRFELQGILLGVLAVAASIACAAVAFRTPPRS